MPATSSSASRVNSIVEVVSAEAPSVLIGSPALVSHKRMERGLVCLSAIILGVMLAVFPSMYLVNGALSLREVVPKQRGVQFQLSPDLVKRVEAGETVYVRIPNGLGPNKTSMVPIYARNLLAYNPEEHTLVGKATPDEIQLAHS